MQCFIFLLVKTIRLQAFSDWLYGVANGRGQSHATLKWRWRAVAIDPSGSNVWLAVSSSNGLKILCWSCVDNISNDGSQDWRLVGVKALYEHERHGVRTMMVLAGSSCILCWITNGDVVIFDSSSYSTIYSQTFVCSAQFPFFFLTPLDPETWRFLRTWKTCWSKFFLLNIIVGGQNTLVCDIKYIGERSKSG